MNLEFRHLSRLGLAFGIPFIQSVATGFLVGLAGGALASLEAWTDPGKVGFVIGASMAAVTWLLLLRRWLELCAVAAYGVDESGVADPGGTDRPGPGGESQLVRVQFSEGRQMQLVDLPANLEQLVTLAGGLLAGATFSESSWTGSGAAFTRSEFKALRDEFLRRGWAVWRRPESPAQGVALTRQGQAVVRHFASMTASPTLPEDNTQTGGISGGARACVRKSYTYPPSDVVQ